MPAGRPTLYRPEYCERVMELGREGKSKAQWAADIGVSRQTLDTWGATHPEFLDALTHATDLQLAWWESKAQEGIHLGGQFNANLWSRSMAARFPNDYTERSKRELTGANGGPIQVSHDEWIRSLE